MSSPPESLWDNINIEEMMKDIKRQYKRSVDSPFFNKGTSTASTWSTNYEQAYEPFRVEKSVEEEVLDPLIFDPTELDIDVDNETLP